MTELFRIPRLATSFLRRFCTGSTASAVDEDAAYLRSLLSSSDPAHQSEAISLLISSPNPDPSISSLLFTTVSRHTQLLSFTSAQLLINLANHGSFPTNTSQFAHITINLCRNAGPTKALEFLSSVRKNGGVLDTRVFNSILNAFVRERDYKSMNQLVSEMRELGVTPDKFTYGITMNYLCKSRQVDDALKLLDEMSNPDSEVKPDTITFNMVIDGLCKAFRLQDGLILLEKTKKSQGCKPDTITYNCLIDGFCKAGDLDTGLKLVAEMEKNDISPSAVTFNSIISGLCRNGKLGTAFDFFKKKKIEWSEITYSTLIGAFLHSNNVAKAMDLYEEMIKNGIKPDPITYYTMISGLSRAGLVNEAFSITSAMKDDGFEPDLKSYNILLNGFCNRKRLDRAREVLDEMTEAGLKPDLFTYNTLLSAFSKTRDFSSVAEILRRMRDNGIKLSIVTYGILINGYCKDDKIDDAMNLFRSMKKNSNTVIYNTLIDALCKKGDVKMAVSLMEEMKEKGVDADVATYNAVLRGLREEKMEEKAFEVMDWMWQERCGPNCVTFDVLLDWLPKIGEKIRLRKFIEAFRDNGSSN